MCFFSWCPAQRNVSPQNRLIRVLACGRNLFSRSINIREARVKQKALFSFPLLILCWPPRTVLRNSTRHSFLEKPAPDLSILLKCLFHLFLNLSVFIHVIALTTPQYNPPLMYTSSPLGCRPCEVIFLSPYTPSLPKVWFTDDAPWILDG